MTARVGFGSDATFTAIRAGSGGFLKDYFDRLGNIGAGMLLSV
jgi:hypothetical protein